MATAKTEQEYSNEIETCAHHVKFSYWGFRHELTGELADVLTEIVMLDEGIGDAAHEDRRFARECIEDARAALLKAGITSSTTARA